MAVGALCVHVFTVPDYHSFEPLWHLAVDADKGVPHLIGGDLLNPVVLAVLGTTEAGTVSE